MTKLDELLSKPGPIDADKLLEILSKPEALDSRELGAAINAAFTIAADIENTNQMTPKEAEAAWEYKQIAARLISMANRRRQAEQNGTAPNLLIYSSDEPIRQFGDW